jgi:uracil-DNA glycosylase family 4
MPPTPAEDAAGGTGLDALAKEIACCRRCPRLVTWREEVAAHPLPAFAEERYWARPLPGFGDPAARLIVVGLAPAAHGGNRTGRMFTGDRSGDFLVAGLFQHGFASGPTSVRADDGLALVDAFVTAPVRCAPPANRPLPIERDTCMPYLERELSLLPRAAVYLALGGYAFDCIRSLSSLKGRLGAARFAHGAEFAVAAAEAGRGPHHVVCTYHPSQRNVFTGLLTAEMFSTVLGRARELLDA